MNARAAILVVSLPLVWACASAGSGTGSAGPRHDPNVITAEELQGANVSNLFDAIRILRPQWLERGGPTTIIPGSEYAVVVFMDRIRFGEPEVLRQTPPSVAQSLRYYRADEAQAEFGIGNLRGAIQVITRRER